MDAQDLNQLMAHASGTPVMPDTVGTPVMPDMVWPPPPCPAATRWALLQDLLVTTNRELEHTREQLRQANRANEGMVLAMTLATRAQRLP